MSTQQLFRTYDLWRHAAMAADLGPINIAADHNIELNYGYDFQQAGSTAPTLQDIKHDFIREIVLTLGGREICRLDNYDVCHMQNLWFGETPHHLIPGGDDQFGYWRLNTIPLSLDKKDPSGQELRSLDCQLTVGALTDVDHLRICADVHYVSNRNISWLPNGYHYAYQYTDHIAATAGVTYEVPFPRKGADLVGLLVYSEILPTTTNLNTTVDWFRLFVNDQPCTAEIHWLELPTFRTTQNVLDDAGYGAELDNYGYLDLSMQPLPADYLDIEYTTVGDTSHCARFIGIYQEP